MESKGGIHDILRRARDELIHCNYPAAIYFISNTLGTPGTTKKLNSVQLLRLLLFRADAYSALGSHEKALVDAQLAVKEHPDSIQARFILGRELLKLFRIDESVAAFEQAQDMMNTRSDADGLEGDDLLSMQGIRPTEPVAASSTTTAAGGQVAAERSPQRLSDAGVGAVVAAPAKPRYTPSFEWINEYITWQLYSAEASCLRLMTKTNVIPHNSSTSAVQLLLAKVAASANRAIVVTMRNSMEKIVMIKEGESFDDGEYYEKTRFPGKIHPGEVGVAAVRSNSWRGGSKGQVQYKLEGTGLSVKFWFESPLMGSYRSALLLGNTSIVSKGDGSSSIGTAKTPTKKFKALALAPSQVQAFVMAEVRPITLKPAELVLVLEYLPAYALIRTSAVSRSLRNIVSHFPPAMFFCASKKCFPDYCLLSDFSRNIFTVHDPTAVPWKLVSENIAFEKNEISVVDAVDRRVFVVAGDLASRSMDAQIYFGNKKCQLASVAENWNPMSRSATLRTGADRQFATLTTSSGGTITLSSELKPGIPLLSVKKQKLDPKSSEMKFTVSLEPSGVEWATFTFTLAQPRRHAQQFTLGEMALAPGSDALLCTILAVYTLMRSM